MKSFFIQDLKRSFWNLGFLAGVLFVLAILLPVALFDAPLDGSRSFLNSFGNLFHASGFSPFAAIFPVLAYGAVFCEECNSGYLRLILYRAGFVRFVKVRLVTVALSGGVMMAAPIALVCTIAYAGSAHGIPAGSDEGLLEGSKIITAIARYGDWYVIAGKVLLGFLFGVLWALVGFAFAVWIPNRYVSLLAPFILYDALWLFLGDIPFNPVYLLVGDNVRHGDYPLAVLIELLYIGITIPIICAGLKQEGRN